MPHKYVCVLCSKRLKKQKCRPVNRHLQKYLRKNFLLDTSTSDVICGKCSGPAYKANSDRPVHVPRLPQQVRDCNEPVAGFSPPSISLNIKGAPTSHAYCFICKRPGPKLIVVSQTARLNVFLKHNVLISPGSRCCPAHFDGQCENLTVAAASVLPTVDNIYVNRTTILNLLQFMRRTIEHTSNKRLSFDNLDHFNDTDVTNLTGLSKEQFIDLFHHVSSHIRNTPTRSAITTVGIFLAKMKTGLPNKLLSTLFMVSKSSIRRAINTTRHAFMVEFVPGHLGFGHITREDVMNNHTRPLAKSLFCESDDQVVIVLDGTYIYINKSNNFQFQRRSYSLHKGRPLVKPMVIVTSTGYFLSVLGPYFADSKNNDASILKHIMCNNVEQIKAWVRPSDVFIVDRGFRDCIQLLEDLGIQAEMPAFMVKGQRQMPTESANTSRLVTKVRWVVEAANSRIKRWKYLDCVLPTNQIPFIGDYVRIVCAIANKYFAPISATDDTDADTRLAARMLELSKSSNALQQLVETNNMDRKSAKWVAVEDSNISFPKLDEYQLRSITLGTYQLKLSPSYIQEYVGGDCHIQVHQESPNLIRVRLQSRHVSAKTYLVWIQYTPTDVQSWYCRCRAGARTVGVCSHIASILWFLGLSMHEQPTKKYGVKDWGLFLQDAVNIPQTIDASDSDDTDSVIEE